MTANQINYVKHLEDVRSHKVNEALAERQTRASEISASASASQAGTAAQNADTNVLNAESNRLSAQASQLSAMASQQMAAASYMNAETERMYKEAQVRLEEAKQLETQRHNQASESKDLLVLGEDKRHNTATEWQATYDTMVKSGIEAANRNERAREADQSATVTKRGQNFSLGASLASNVTSLVNNVVSTGASLLKPFKSGFNAGQLSKGG